MTAPTQRWRYSGAMRLLTLIAALFAAPALADAPLIENVTARANGASWTFNVTLSHPDSGWDHYADGWRILDMSGNELGLRVLHHPHEQEQPFTRSLSLALPDGTTEVWIQARCNTYGWGDRTYLLTLP